MNDSVYYNQEFNVYVKIDAVKSLSATEDGDAWVFEGIASTKDVDLYNEVVYPESFLNSIDFFKNNGKIFFDHDYAKENASWLSNHGFSKDEILALRTPIGKPLDAKITDEGLYIRAILNKEHPMARLMWNQYLNNKDSAFNDQLGLSIGAKYLGQPRKEFDSLKGKYITYLPDLLLYEVSLTPEPVNPHTKSWRSAIKSMMSKASEPSSTHHTIKPDKIDFDNDNKRIVVKSTVTDSDGANHTIEQVIELEEDFINSMNKNSVSTKKAATTLKAQPQPQQMMGGAPMDPSMMGGAPGGAPMDPSMMGGAPGGAPMDPSMMGGAPGGAPMDPSMMGGAPMDPSMMGGAAPGGGGGGVLEQLAQQSDDPSGGDSETGQPQNDDSMKMILDNMSTMMDMLSNLTEKVEALEGSSSAPAESQVTTQMPNLKSLNRDYKNYVKKAVSAAVYELSRSINSMTKKSVIKSVSISDESADMLADTIKGVLLSIEDSIVNNVTERLLSETTVVKSASSRNDNRNDAKIVHPGAYVDGMSNEGVDSRVQKSVKGNGGEEEISAEKMDTLKSLVEEYNSIRGYTADKSQQRARIIDEARDYLGVHPTLFATYANRAQKSRL